MHDADKLRLQVVIPAYQPLHATGEALAEQLHRVYLPLIDALEASPHAVVALHFGGHLLDYFARHHEGLLMRLKNLCRRGQIEILSGLFYGGFVSHLAEQDVRSQIEMAREYWESFIGEAPAGFWLPELAWAAELPRLFSDTNLQYGFVSDSQLRPWAPAPCPSLGCVERAGCVTTAFVLNSAASGALASCSPRLWLDDLSRQPHDAHLCSAWVRAEDLAQAIGGPAAFFAALSAPHPAVRLTLPRTNFTEVRPTHSGIVVREVVPSELSPSLSERCQYGDFVATHPEVALLQRRLVRGSQKLRDVIAVMEDERLEEDWSDNLATAQRFIFAAQTPEALWQGRHQGFADPALRDAVVRHLSQAEVVLDTLVQGNEAWIGCEELDLDADLRDEVWISTIELAAWVAPARGAQIYCIDNRATDTTVLDASQTHGPVPRGICGTFLPAQTTAEQFFATQVGQPWQPRGAWMVQQNGIDADGDCSFTCSVHSEGPAMSGSQTHLGVSRRVHVPIEGAQVHITDVVASNRPDEGFWVCQIPLRLGTQPQSLRVNGQDTPLLACMTLSDVSELELWGGQQLGVAINFVAPVDLWATPLNLTASCVPGAGGLLLAPRVALAGEVRLSWSLRLLAPRHQSADLPEGSH